MIESFINVYFTTYTMKKKLSISIEEEKIKLLKKMVKNGKFRNKSHLVEYSIDKFLEKENGK